MSLRTSQCNCMQLYDQDFSEEDLKSWKTLDTFGPINPMIIVLYVFVGKLKKNLYEYICHLHLFYKFVKI